ncbi:hypothetical protein PYW07_002536 [Mythimna separata]|uniref:U-box domain-containing protein n=1 Tax=Mythimna separata TaxID=271217 RepID=A0AAD7YGV0_MYTSE|nr:hypothetical protein PYW07_002536 [Mythimna separata]
MEIMEEIEEPTLVQTLRAHRTEVTCADAMGALLVTGSGDRSLRLWRWAAGAGWDEAARAENAHRYGVTAARWAASGALLASGGVDGAARVWAARTLAPRRLLAAPGAAAVRALCWAARARLLSGHDDGVLCVWHVPRAQLLARLHAHEGALHAVAAPARGAMLLTACTHGVLKVFDLAEVCRSGITGAATPPALAWVDNVHDLGALCAAVTEDGALCATGGQDALVCLWHSRAEDGWPRGLLAGGVRARGHAAAVTALRWAGWGARALLASASLDRTARLWLPAGAELRCVRVVHAHSRYLTCVVLAHDMRYLLTGSNDRTLRMWSLGSLTLDDQLDTPCEALAHFGLGDLKGIGPVDDEVVEQPGDDTETAPDGDEEEATSMRRLWAGAVHAGTINYIATHGDLVATASSDGVARVFRWAAAARELQPLHALAAHHYPVMACDFAAAGSVLLTAGLDGRACVWDVESGVQLRSLSVPACAGAEGEAGGGGMRAARAAPRRPALLLLATDDGLAPLWSLDDDDPKPLHVFMDHSAAVTCCAWSCDARLAATGSAAGELCLHAPPPSARLLHHDPHAHDLEGVQSCDFAPSPSALALPENTYLLATAGADSLIKMWSIHYDEELASATVRAVQTLELHGGGATSLRWGGALLAAAGADRVLRVWRVAARGAAARLLAVLAGDGGALAVALLADRAGPLLLCGSLGGELAAWRVPAELRDDEDDEDGTPPCYWQREGVRRWLRECITHVPGSELQPDEETFLIQRAEEANMTGSKLLSVSMNTLLEHFGYAAVDSDAGADSEAAEDARPARMRDELAWLRAPPPSYDQERAAPHALLCPLSHRVMHEPVFAADGYTYERANILDWFLAADGAVSPVSGRRLLSACLQLNYGVRAQLRDYLSS